MGGAILGNLGHEVSNMKRSVPAMRLILLFAGLALSAAVAAQNYPSRTIRVIIGYGVGGPTDVVNRIVAAEMEKHLGGAVVVENRPGANGVIAADTVRRSAPDGYTLFGGSATAISPVYVKENAVVASRDFSPVATIALGTSYLFVPSGLKVASLKDLVAWTTANPGKLRFAATSISAQMQMAMISKRLGITFDNIPYKTTDQALAALLTGDAQAAVQAASGFEGALAAGKLRVIAIMSGERDALVPDVPTATEQGVPLVVRFNQSLWAPRGTPRDITAKLNTAVNDSLKIPQVVQTMRNVSFLPSPMTPEEVVKTYESEIAFYTEAAALIGFTPQ
jgi:tripartite-type tricarboxylate transporter receptor subunit TctC